MTIDTAILDAIGDNWMVRNDTDGRGHGGFLWNPIGEWTTCQKWDDATVKPDCYSGGLFGQGPDLFGETRRGNRFALCETRGRRISVGGSKIKVKSARVLYIGAQAMAALVYLCGDAFGGSLDLSGCDLTGFTAPVHVGGYLYLRGARMDGCKTVAEIRAKIMGGGK